MALSLSKAAKLGKVAKTTLADALKNGDLSASKNDKGHWLIEEAELGRWLDTRSPVHTETDIENGFRTPEKPPENSSLEVEVAVLRERVKTLDEERDRERAQLTDEIEDLRDRLTKADAERTKLTAVITDQREAAEKDAEKPKGFWARLTG